MKIQVLKNRAGRVIATFEPKGGATVSLQPQLSSGQKVEDAEMSKDYVSQLDAVYKTKGTTRKKATSR